MKKIYLMIMLLAIVACTKEQIGIDRGDQLDPDALAAPASVGLHSGRTAGDLVSLEMLKGEGMYTEDLYVVAGKPLDATLTLMLQAEPSLVQSYSAAAGVEYQELPASFYEFIGGGAFEFREGLVKSEARQIKIFSVNKMGNVLECGRYLLPVTLVSPTSDSSSSTIYIDVTVREPYETLAPLHDGSELFMIFYINTSEFDPRLATSHYISKMDFLNPDGNWKAGVGNIVNLRKTSVGYDEESGRAVLTLSSDMRYLIDNYNEYIRPVQETGRKVCLCIEGGGKGIGFCNMTDEQIADFVSQVMYYVNEFGFDGVNLWDRNSGYGTDGMPQVNKTSYPKLIKALREALGNYKLLTLVDYEEPTADFWDVAACGGIEVGKYIDYAWSGYMENLYEVVDPYNPGGTGVSTEHIRKPIAGLNSKRYCCVMGRPYTKSDNPNVDSDAVQQWLGAGLRQNNMSVHYDVRSNTQDEYEGAGCLLQAFLMDFLGWNNPYMLDFFSLSDTPSGYNKWKKSW